MQSHKKKSSYCIFRQTAAGSEAVADLSQSHLGVIYVWDLLSTEVAGQESPDKFERGMLGQDDALRELIQ